jgi:delta8-fatty-acid desaturase
MPTIMSVTMRMMPMLEHTVTDLYPVVTLVALVTGALAGITAVLVCEITETSAMKEQALSVAELSEGGEEARKLGAEVADKERGGVEHKEAHTGAEGSSKGAVVKAVKKQLQVISLEELAKHNVPEDLWLCIHGTVYDLTKWHQHHPGGKILLKYGGTDASDEFEAFHRARVLTRLNRLRKVATLAQTCPGNDLPCSVEYRELRQKLWASGIFEADTSLFGYFFWKQVVVAAFAASVLTCFFHPALFATSWVRLLVGPTLLGFVWQQGAFLAHDALHNGVVVPEEGGGFNFFGWVYGTLVFGISSEKWLYEHNLHHSMTLRPCEDPQFDYLPMWLQSVKEVPLFKAGKAKVPHCWIQIKLCEILIPFQHITILPLCVIAGRFNYYAESFEYAISNKAWKDIVGMSIYWCWYSALLCMLPSAYERMIFTLVSHCAVGILHVQLLVSHLCTENFTAEEQAELGFFKFQMLTTRNINSCWYDHWFHGGLELQIEHHLFPQLPRHNLSKVKPMVMALCKKHDVPYVSVGFCEAIGICLSDLRVLARELAFIDLN